MRTKYKKLIFVLVTQKIDDSYFGYTAGYEYMFIFLFANQL